MSVVNPRLNSLVPRWNFVGHLPVSAGAALTALGMVSDRSGRSCARAALGVARRSATPSASHRRPITSVFVEVLLDGLCVGRLEQRQPKQHAGLLRVESERGDGAEA